MPINNRKAYEVRVVALYYTKICFNGLLVKSYGVTRSAKFLKISLQLA